MTGLEILQDSPDLEVPEPAAIPLLAPLQAHDEPALAAEIEARLAEGWRTLKVKVGFDAGHDLERVGFIQAQVAGRATLRLDANQAYSVADGIRFATGLRPEGIELFEQPCSMHDWDANAQVAAVSNVPVMLDEIVHASADIERAATLPGVRFVKLKLKKMGGAARVKRALELIRSLELEPVLGDGSGTDIGNWCEACVARTTNPQCRRAQRLPQAAPSAAGRAAGGPRRHAALRPAACRPSTAAGWRGSPTRP